MNLRTPTALSLLLAATLTQAAPPVTFDGTWRETWCSPGPRQRCGWIEFQLVGQGARLCGTFATQSVDEERVDGGRVVGVVAGNAAVLAVTSELRDGSIWIGRLRPAPAGRLQWELAGLVKDADPDREGAWSIVPSAADLSPAKRGRVEPAAQRCPG